MYEFRNHVIMQYACLKATITYIQYIIYSITYIQYITYSITYIQYTIYSITYTQYIIYILFPIFIVTQSMSHAFFGGSCKATYMHGASCHITTDTVDCMTRFYLVRPLPDDRGIKNRLYFVHTLDKVLS